MSEYPPRCSDCRYSHYTTLDEDIPSLLCVRYPPVLFVLDGEPTQMRPQVEGDDSCGEFRHFEHGRRIKP